MKKILLLILTFLVLFVGCQKEDQQQEENGLGPVTQEYTCPNCGAKYSIYPNIDKLSITYTLTEKWEYYTYGDNWIVKDAAGEIIPHFEWYNKKMYFICTCGKKSKEFKIDEFKTQTAIVK